MPQYVSLLGVSGVGKRSFADALLSDHHLRHMVGVSEPFAFIDATQQDEPCFDQLEALGRTNGDIVIKW